MGAAGGVPAERETGEEEVNEAWSPPDRDGVVTRTLDVGAVSTLRGRRRRRGTVQRLSAIPLWPASWRDLLKDWLRQGSSRRKWTALLTTAGGQRVHDALPLLDALLKAGLVDLEETRENLVWQPLWVEFTQLEASRAAVGLTNRTSLQREREAQSGYSPDNGILEPLRKSLESLPVERAVKRHELLLALDRWISDERSGTRRDFALSARGDTKGITTAEWAWLDGHLDLEAIGISRHTPALWLRAPLVLVTVTGKMAVSEVPDCIGLTPATIDTVVRIEGPVSRWLILENRTVFERVARHKEPSAGVVWVPGFAPTWWKDAVSHIIRLCPAPAMIACDPDPAGIDICLDVGTLWSSYDLTWEPWKMDSDSFVSLRQKKELSEDDRLRLQRILTVTLPDTLRELALLMLERGEKGEQEGISFA